MYFLPFAMVNEHKVEYVFQTSFTSIYFFCFYRSLGGETFASFDILARRVLSTNCFAVSILKTEETT